MIYHSLEIRIFTLPIGITTNPFVIIPPFFEDLKKTKDLIRSNFNLTIIINMNNLKTIITKVIDFHSIIAFDNPSSIEFVTSPISVPKFSFLTSWLMIFICTCSC